MKCTVILQIRTYHIFSFCTLLLLLTKGDLLAQDQPARWNLFVDQEYVSDARLEDFPVDSLDAVIDRIIRQQQIEGYYLARLDSIHVVDFSGQPGVAIYLERGPLVRISTIQLHGAGAVGEAGLYELMDTRIGETLDPQRLDADIGRIISAYENAGYHFAKVRIDALQIEDLDEGQIGLKIKLVIEEGTRVKINDIMLIGAKRTNQSYLEFLMGVEDGQWLLKDLNELRTSLDRSQLFSRVSPVELIQVNGEEHIMVVSVDEEQPGSFDLVLGYQPPGASGSSGLVGNGHLDLRNPFGSGRRIGLQLNRLPGQVSAVDARYEDSYFFGTPFSIEAGFEGLQQDSTYSQQSFKAAIGYSFRDGLETFATVNRQVTRPGQAGIELVQAMQRIPRSEITFWGFSIRYTSVSRPLNPQQGLYIETSLEGGRKQRSGLIETSMTDTSIVTTRVRQQRLEAVFRLYIPVFTRQVLAIGNDINVLVSEEFDVSDLFRLGGARSLRGYDEDRFRVE